MLKVKRRAPTPAHRSVKPESVTVMQTRLRTRKISWMLLSTGPTILSVLFPAVTAKHGHMTSVYICHFLGYKISVLHRDVE